MLALSHVLLSVELFIQKVEKTILETVLETEMLTLSRSLQFSLTCIDLELFFMSLTLLQSMVGIEETIWKLVAIHFSQCSCQIWKLTNKTDFIPRRCKWAWNHHVRSLIHWKSLHLVWKNTIIIGMYGFSVH